MDRPALEAVAVRGELTGPLELPAIEPDESSTITIPVPSVAGALVGVAAVA
ncbi:hypothetical protein [Streptomyces platensis]|uniref:hypothetical protein n=1 Tax=Streptomyces platensis TaxID=58346 RepID=UPI00379DCAE2